MPSSVSTHHDNFHCFLSSGVGVHHGLLRVHIVAKGLDNTVVHSANQKTSPSPLLINIDVTPT